MMRATKKWDTTRPFSANLNQVPPSSAPHANDTLDFLASYMDVEGFSHGSIAKEGAGMIYDVFPKKNFISSECRSGLLLVSSRLVLCCIARAGLSADQGRGLISIEFEFEIALAVSVCITLI